MKTRISAILVMVLVWFIAYIAVSQNPGHGHGHGHGNGHNVHGPKNHGKM